MGGLMEIFLKFFQSVLLVSGLFIGSMGIVLAQADGTVKPADFIGASSQLDAANLEALAETVEADPFAVADELEAGLGGPQALQRYAHALIASGQAKRLGAQWAKLVADPEGLAQGREQDGSIWYPLAEDVGFVTGGLATVLQQDPAHVAAFAQGTGLPDHVRGQDVLEWMTIAVQDLSGPVRQAFDQAARAGAFKR